MPFIELSAISNFTFLTGASHPEELITRALDLGLPALAIADTNSVAGIVRAHTRAREIARKIAEDSAQDRKQDGGPDGEPDGAPVTGRKPPQDAKHNSGPRAGPVTPPPSGPPIRLIPAARLVLSDGMEITALPRDRAAWGRLCRLLTLGRTRAPKGDCDIGLTDLLAWGEGMTLLLHPPEIATHKTASPEITAQKTTAPKTTAPKTAAPKTAAQKTAAPRTTAPRPAPPEPGTSQPPPRPAQLACPVQLTGQPPHRTSAPSGPETAQATSPVPGGAGDWVKRAQSLTRRFPGACHLALAPAYDGQDLARFARLTRLADHLQIPTLATARPLMHHGARRRLADVLTAIRLGRRIEALGLDAAPHAETRLRSEAEMLRLFRGFEDAVHRAGALAQSLTFSLDELRYEYPSEVADGETPAARLARLAWEGLAWRYPEGPPERASAQMRHELDLIGKLKYEPYFLTVHDIVAFARSRNILCQGRGSAANSITCYALGVTSVSPEIGTMVFERFISEARNEPPDIDVDFEHERREEVIQHIYEKYGRHRAGLCATVIHYRGKRAVREVGRAMGLTEDTLSAMSSQIWGFGSSKTMNEQRLREIGLDPADRRLQLTLSLIEEIQGFPRHLSQHVGGFIITEGRLDELVPIENATMEDRTVICWDKDDIDALGILKVDILALGMLSCIRKAFDLLQKHHQADYTLATLPPEDARVYDMLGRADSLGVFQVESRAQMNFLPRMRPACFYDLVIQVAIIRPGPIQGDMVHPYLRRRNGQEVVTFPSDALGRVLGKTLGVPLFQEQAMQIAIIGAGFTPSEADRLRRSLATFKKHGSVSEFHDRFLAGMAANGYDTDFAARCFAQIEGFGSYGFPESHAASFALLVYASAWVKCHHPGIFACALLNSQPMGFYAPAQIVRDAREHGVLVLPPAINRSAWDNVMEETEAGLALRLGLRQITGLAEEEALWITAARRNGYTGVQDVWRRAGASPATLERLAEADAFADLGITRREALWEARALVKGRELPLFAGDLDGEGITEPAVVFAQMSEGEAVVEDYLSLRLTLRRHPMALLRPWFTPDLSPPPQAAATGGIEPPPAALPGTAATGPVLAQGRKAPAHPPAGRWLSRLSKDEARQGP
ncbi:error-prone DNA polymerase [Rhodobacter sp. KR11]|uniref:error-prone DNA polymerase n=1 Tax=Rhodobacter sp. KR11 TaxID=2974588 RepID=UPI002221BDB6|nr:error-prone DNA polymerase [Rhodobacter sp. KR11]